MSGNQREAMIEYLKRRKEELKVHITKQEQMFEKSRIEITEMKDRISELEHRVDAAYEVFSPISVQQQVVKAETDRLKEEVEEKLAERTRIQTEYEKLKAEGDEIQNLLQWEMGAPDKEESKDVTRIGDLGRSFIETQELERQRIARDLHDTTVQNLTALLHKIEFCAQVLNSDPIRVRIELEVISQVIRESVNGMREIIYNLRPMTFDDMGFDDALVHAIERMQKGFDTKIVFEINGESYDTKQVIQLTVLRIIQEAINNCKKYAKANMIDIILSYQKDMLEVSIMDDGVGFDVNHMPERKNENTGFGLSMMKERVHLLNGTFEIESKTGFGTEIQVRIPIKDGVECL